MQDLRPAIRRLTEVIRPDFENRGIELVVDVEDETIEMQFDERQLDQALLNLIRNAMEAIETKREGEADSEARVEVRVRADRSYAWIQVIDTGCGIAKEDLNRIIEPYYTTKFSGSGLGMMIVYRVARAHGGGLEIQSDKGEGTTATLTLPRRRQISHQTGEKAPSPNTA
jgi:signal transduction histidine kinase